MKLPSIRRAVTPMSILLVLGIFLMVLKNDAVASYGYNMTGSTTGFTTAGSAPGCGSTAPEAPWLYSAVARGNEVDLTWAKVDNVSSWTVAYGLRSGTYLYGLSNFGNGDSRSVAIGHLPSGTYYFVIRANNGCKPGPFSAEQRVSVGRSYITTASVETLPPTTYEPVVPFVPQVTQPVGRIQPIQTFVSPTPRPTTVSSQPRGQTTPFVTPVPQNKGFFQRLLDTLFGGSK